MYVVTFVPFHEQIGNMKNGNRICTYLRISLLQSVVMLYLIYIYIYIYIYIHKYCMLQLYIYMLEVLMCSFPCFRGE